MSRAARRRVRAVCPDDYWYEWIDEDGVAHKRRPHVVAYLVGHEPSGVPPREIPDGMTVVQTCETPTCCNPAHLELAPGRLEGF